MSTGQGRHPTCPQISAADWARPGVLRQHLEWKPYTKNCVWSGQGASQAAKIMNNRENIGGALERSGLNPSHNALKSDVFTSGIFHATNE